VRSSFRVVPRVAAVLVVVALSMTSGGEATATVGRAALHCQQLVAAAGPAFVARQLADLERCAGASLACAETAPDDRDCLPSARARCERLIARMQRREHKFAHSVATGCAAVDVGVLLEASGLGFAQLAPLCPALGTEHGDAKVLGVCLAGLTRCRGERLFATAFPRGGELLRVAGVAEPLRASLSCLPDRGGSGRGERDLEVGAVVTRCARRVARGAAYFARRTLANVSRCTRATRVCLEGDHDAGSGEDACRTAAADTCTVAFARIASARRAFGRTTARVCGTERIDFARLAAASGADLQALADDCVAVQLDAIDAVPSLVECLARNHDCELAELVRQATPRADELLALGGQAIAYPYCRAPVPTKSATPVPSTTPTVTRTGPTRTPRPGETATPTPRATPSPQPTATPFCGNGEVEDGEECDGANFDDEDCESLCFDSAPSGTLACSSGCTIDFNGCHGEDCEAP
jgi:hypothetical protein